MKLHKVCRRHNFSVLIGAGTPVSELDCIHCTAQQDAEYVRSGQPCCSRANIDCCGHGDDDGYDLPVSPTWAIGANRYGPLVINSANFCDAPPF